MELQRVTKSQAIRLKELKFDNEVNCYYLTNGEIQNTTPVYLNFNKVPKIISAPELDLVCKWFRDKHKISVETGCNASGWYSGIGKVDGTTITALFDEGPNPGGCWNTYEQTQSAAIDWLLGNEGVWNLTKETI